uniref:Uncharacterized protein n=1 Tax=Octopus bimaculoides TaxID=37653 RepID=A0A0L8I9Z8_OCTBM
MHSVKNCFQCIDLAEVFSNLLLAYPMQVVLYQVRLVTIPSSNLFSHEVSFSSLIIST